MDAFPLVCTKHAAMRKAQRNLSDADIAFVLSHGQQRHCAGALHVFLGRRDIPTDAARYHHFTHLEGTVLVIKCTPGPLVLITVYRNRGGVKMIRRKARFDRHVHAPRSRFSEQPAARAYGA